MAGDLQPEILPIPDPQYVGVTTYDAKDPDTKFPPVEYTIPDSEFNGKVLGVQLDVDTSEADRYISAEDRLRIAMARQ